MHHSFSSESFVKPSQHARLPHAQHRIQNDITVPKEYMNHKQLLEQVSEESPQKSNISNRSISKLKKKIKQIKWALKIAQQHNEQLHMKLNEQKKCFNDEKKIMEIQVNKYKSLYEMLIENYEGRSLELKQTKKRLRKLQKQQSRSNLQLHNQHQANLLKQAHRLQEQANRLQEQQQNKRLKQAMTEQQVNLQHTSHENKLLREQIILKNKKISQYQILIETYQAEQTIRKSSMRNQQFQLISKLQMLQEDNKRLKKDKDIAVTKVKRLEVELESTKRLRESVQKDMLKMGKQHEQLKLQYVLIQKLHQNKESQPDPKWKLLYEDTQSKYNELLKFSYQIQNDFQRQLHTMAKEMTRRQIIKNHHAHS